MRVRIPLPVPMLGWRNSRRGTLKTSWSLTVRVQVPPPVPDNGRAAEFGEPCWFAKPEGTQVSSGFDSHLFRQTYLYNFIMPYSDPNKRRMHNRSYYLSHKRESRLRSRKWLEKNRQKRNAYQRSYYRSHKNEAYLRSRMWCLKNRQRKNTTLSKWRNRNPLRQLIAYAKYRAKRLRVPFNITISDLVMPKTCPVFGYRLKYGARSFAKHQPAQHSPSLDRIDPAKGYVKGNVIIVSWRANALKKDATIKELTALAKFYGRFKR